MPLPTFTFDLSSIKQVGQYVLDLLGSPARYLYQLLTSQWPVVQ